MSSCKCEPPVSLRISDEAEYGEVSTSPVGGFTDIPVVRLRCRHCGGKAGFTALTVTALNDEIEKSAAPGGREFVQLDISTGKHRGGDNDK